MSMARKLFRPGQGQVPARFAAFRLNGTAAYRGDVVMLDTTAPGSQGASGVVDGKTLGANDFIYVVSTTLPANEATIGQGAVAGVIEGKGVGDRNTTTALTDDGIVIVQVAGVHEQVWMSANTGVAQWLALADSTSTLGAARPIVGVGVTTLGGAQLSYLVGVILGTNATTGARAAVTNANFCPVWIRCGDVV